MVFFWSEDILKIEEYEKINREENKKDRLFVAS